MHRKRTKRRQRIQLTFVYTLMALAVVSIVAILILVIQGYRYNRFDGRLEQGGLVQFNSQPSGATVAVDDLTLANKTASKVTLTAGQHTVRMTREGYSSWKKDVLVKPGSILWLNYALLFPNSPKITTATNYASVSSAVASPNHKTMAAIAAASSSEIILTTLNDDTPISTKLAVPKDSFTAPDKGETQSFTLLSWDKDNHSLLIRHTYGKENEYLSLDTRSGKARNVTAELGVSIDKVAYSLADSNTLYILTSNHELRRANISSSTLSGPLATNVENFYTTEERIVSYVTLADKNKVRTVGYVSPGSTKAKVIATYAASDAPILRVATGNYYGDHYLAILHGKTLRIQKGDFPASDSDTPLDLEQVTSLTVSDTGDYLGFSPENNRMVYVAKNSQVVTYDLELKTTATTTLQNPLTTDVQWLDSYHLLAVGKNGYYYDYDGTNSQLFASNTLDLPAVLSENDKYIYYFTSAEGGTVLQRVKLTIN